MGIGVLGGYRQYRRICLTIIGHFQSFATSGAAYLDMQSAMQDAALGDLSPDEDDSPLRIAA